VVETGVECGYSFVIIADHGNADYAVNEDGSPNTAHTLNPVPLFVIDNNWHGTVKPGKLGDIAPSILTMMQIPIPAEMTGDILVN
jgi:2,3-bisphosphoglycerate-independent phosphoglycerate mutase